MIIKLNIKQGDKFVKMVPKTLQTDRIPVNLYKKIKKNYY